MCANEIIHPILITICVSGGALYLCVRVFLCAVGFCFIPIKS